MWGVDCRYRSKKNKDKREILQTAAESSALTTRLIEQDNKVYTVL